MNKIVTLFFILTLGAFSALAQPAIPENFCERKGKEDMAKTKQRYSAYKEFFTKENYGAAKKFWVWMFHNAPGFHEVVLIDGAAMYQEYAKLEEDPTVKSGLRDTMLMLFDMREQCYAKDEAAIKNIVIRKAYAAADVFDHTDWKALQGIYRETIDRLANETSAYFINSYFATQFSALRANEIDCNQLLDISDELIEIANTNIDAGKDVEDYQGVVDYVENTIPNECLTCESLTVRYENAFESRSTDVKWLEKAMSTLYHKGCSSTPIYSKVKDALCGLQPSATCFRRYAEEKLAVEDYDGAISDLDQAINLEGDLDKKAKDVLNKAKIYRKKGEYSQARTTAKQALQYKPNWGEVYILIADLYAGSGQRCGGSASVDGIGVCWVAFDAYARAKSIDPSVSERAQKGMNRMAAYFPKPSQLWELGLKEGQTITINCWIGVSTRVRAKG